MDAYSHKGGCTDAQEKALAIVRGVNTTSDTRDRCGLIIGKNSGYHVDASLERIRRVTTLSR